MTQTDNAQVTECSACGCENFVIEQTSILRGFTQKDGTLVANKHLEEHHVISCCDCDATYDFCDFKDIEHDW